MPHAGQLEGPGEGDGALELGGNRPRMETIQDREREEVQDLLKWIQ